MNDNQGITPEHLRNLGNIVPMNQKPVDDRELEKAAQKTADYLYSLSDDCPDELRVPIGQLRQMINEEFVHKGKSVSSQLIWDMLKEVVPAHFQKKYLGLLKKIVDDGEVVNIMVKMERARILEALANMEGE